MSLPERPTLPLLDIPSVPTIDSSTFLSYLFRDYSKSDRFSSELDLSGITPVIDYLYQQKIAVDLYSGEEKQHREKYDPEEARRQVPAERNTVLFYDPDTHDYHICPVTHGDFTSVESQILKIGISGKLPLIDIHTHPQDNLPSPQDYGFLIRDPTESLGLVNAILVLCPQVQILALATPQTPALGYKERESFLEQFENEIKSDPKTTAVEQKVAAMVIDHINQIETRIASSFESLKKVAGEPDEIPLEVLQKWEKDQRQQTASLAQELGDKLSPVNMDFLNHGAKNLNAALLRVARLWNIQLYMSTDKSNFFKFSA